MNRTAAATIAVGLVAGALAPVRAPADEPSADDIVARNVAARGGADAWRKVETMVWVGHIESAHAPVPGMRFLLEQKRPNKTRLEIDAAGERSLRAFDGVRGWKARPGRGGPEMTPYTPEEVKYAQARQGLDGPLIDYAAKGNSVTLRSLDEIAGHKAYHLAVHLANGGDEDVWVDAATYLDVRHDRTAEGPGGARRQVSVVYGDYRTVEGLRIPFLIETGGGGARPDRMQIERVVLNAPLDDSRFGNTGAARRRDPGRPGVASRIPMPAAPTAGTAPPGAAPR